LSATFGILRATSFAISAVEGIGGIWIEACFGTLLTTASAISLADGNEGKVYLGSLLMTASAMSFGLAAGNREANLSAMARAV
jgi:hypothetical protein